MSTMEIRAFRSSSGTWKHERLWQFRMVWITTGASCSFHKTWTAQVEWRPHSSAGRRIRGGPSHYGQRLKTARDNSPFLPSITPRETTTVLVNQQINDSNLGTAWVNSLLTPARNGKRLHWANNANPTVVIAGRCAFSAPSNQFHNGG